MSNRIHALAQQLTGKETIEECSLDEVKHIAKRHPYFAPAQFLLLQKLKQLNSPEAEPQYQKTVLFYHDPLLFDYFISSDKFYVDEEGLFDKKDNGTIIQFNDEGSVQSPESEVLLASDYAMEEVKLEASIATEEKLNEHIPDPILPEDVIPGQAKNEIVTNEIVTNEENMVETAESEIVEPAIPFNQFHKEISSSNETSELAFEPFHTVDYFASQGIKISQEELPKDKLGKQLKSFTQWLKTMKRLPAIQTTEPSESSAEKKVETMADRSVSESEVVTEAMAEVWAKQGNREKAMETYNKLSLLNPSKRAYFAAKIENLKHS